jgi:hypothetical protein
MADLMTDDIEAGRGRWVTMHGRRVFIGGDRQGEQLGDARTEQLDRARRGEVGAAAKGKSSWEGYGAAEILRLMGKEGLSYAEAKRACEALGLTPAEPTIRRQLGEGKKGISIPDLDDRQRGIFDDVVNKVRSEKPEPAPKPEPKPEPVKKEKEPEPKKTEKTGDGPTKYTKDNSPLYKSGMMYTAIKAAAAHGLNDDQIKTFLKLAAFDKYAIEDNFEGEVAQKMLQEGRAEGGLKSSIRFFTQEERDQIDELVLIAKGGDDLKVTKGDKIPPAFELVGARELIWHAGKRGLNLKQTKELLDRVGMAKDWAKMDPNDFAMKLALRTGRQRKIEKDRTLTPKQEKAFDEEVLKMTDGKGPMLPKSGRQVREDIEALIEKNHPELKKISADLEAARKDFKENGKKGSIQHQSNLFQRVQRLESDFSTKEFFARRDIHKALALPEDLRSKVSLEYAGPKGKTASNGMRKDELAKISSDFLSTVISNDYADEMKIKAADTNPKSQDRYRSYYGMDGTIYMADQAGADTWTHEAGHYLEDLHREALKASKDFVEFRTEGTPLKKLSEVVAGSGYRDNEVTREDEFINPYIGKDYGGSATEVMSMGLQYLHKNPVELLTQDPGMFEHVVNVARGIHGNPEEHEEQYNRWQKLTAK